MPLVFLLQVLQTHSANNMSLLCILFSEMRNFLIFAQRTNIRKISLDVDYFADVALPIRSLKNAIAISVDRVEGKLVHRGQIVKSSECYRLIQICSYVGNNTFLFQNIFFF